MFQPVFVGHAEMPFQIETQEDGPLDSALYERVAWRGAELNINSTGTWIEDPSINHCFVLRSLGMTKDRIQKITGLTKSWQEIHFGPLASSYASTLPLAIQTACNEGIYEIEKFIPLDLSQKATRSLYLAAQGRKTLEISNLLGNSYESTDRQRGQLLDKINANGIDQATLLGFLGNILGKQQELSINGQPYATIETKYNEDIYTGFWKRLTWRGGTIDINPEAGGFSQKEIMYLSLTAIGLGIKARQFNFGARGWLAGTIYEKLQAKRIEHAIHRAFEIGVYRNLVPIGDIDLTDEAKSRFADIAVFEGSADEAPIIKLTDFDRYGIVSTREAALMAHMIKDSPFAA